MGPDSDASLAVLLALRPLFSATIKMRRRRTVYGVYSGSPPFTREPLMHEDTDRDGGECVFFSSIYCLWNTDYRIYIHTEHRAHALISSYRIVALTR